MRAHHDLKIWPEFFDMVLVGRKRFELRRDDRNFQVHDTLTLKEFDPEASYSGREIQAHITYKLTDAAHFGLMDGHCILGIRTESDREQSDAEISLRKEIEYLRQCIAKNGALSSEASLEFNRANDETVARKETNPRE